jgi:hypothetical protein
MADVRQRKKAEPPSTPPKPPKSASALAKDEDSSSFSILDIFRVLTFVVLVSSALSYFITRKSFVWGLDRPDFTRLDVIKSWIVSSPPSLSFLHPKLTFLLPRLAQFSTQTKI